MSKPKKPNKKSKLLPNLVYGYHVPGIDDLVYAASMDELADDPSATDGIKVGIYELKEVRMLQRTLTGGTMEDQPKTLSIQIGTKIAFIGGGAEGMVVVTLTPEVGEPLTAHLNAAEAQDISTRLTAAAFDTVNDMFLYGYFMMIIRQNQPDMPEESKHQLASKQVVNIRQFRKSMEEAAAAAIPHDTAIPA